MALQGTAALVMWWDMAPDMLREFEDWHSHEHFRERLSIDGFRRATRWRQADGGEGIFQMYELAAYETLSSPQYLARLNAPTPWSTRMMPHHRNMVRCQCRVLASCGGQGASHALTLRLSPAPGSESALAAQLQALAARLADRPGCVGAHLLAHEAPPITQTAEQRIRGGDRSADWVLVVSGYESATLQALLAAELSPQSLAGWGVAQAPQVGLYALSLTIAATDLA